MLRRHRLILEFNGPCIQIGGADPRLANTGLINPVGRLDTSMLLLDLNCTQLTAVILRVPEMTENCEFEKKFFQ